MIGLQDSPLASYFKEVDSTSLLAAANEHDLAIRIRNGDEGARDQMIRANLRFVVSRARKFMGRGLSLQDLIQEGNIGLVSAVQRFDPSRNTRFTTYAKFWIDQAMRNALENMATTVRVPGYAIDLLADWNRKAAQLAAELGRQPTQEEVARKMNLAPKKLRILQKALRIYNHAPRSFNEDGFCHDILIDHSAIEPDHALAKIDELGQVTKLLDRMEPRRAAVLRLRYGLGGEGPMTLSQIGIRLGLTRERVRQIEKAALNKLRELLEGKDVA